jgi:type IV pilus assembly protein PilV
VKRNGLLTPAQGWRLGEMIGFTRWRCPPAPIAARLRGFTIIEVLAALLVIAVGIVGIAALYSDAVQTTTEAHLHTRAAEMAEQIAKRIQENAAGRVGYAGTVGVVCRPDPPPLAPLDAAANEAACWEARVEEALPSGLGTITRDTSTSPVSYVVAVSWSAPETGAASYVIQVQPGVVRDGDG